MSEGTQQVEHDIITPYSAHHVSFPITNELSDDTISHIFQFLEVTDLLHSGAACKKWRSLSSQDHLWRQCLSTEHEKDLRDVFIASKKTYYEDKYRAKAVQFHEKIEVTLAYVIGAICIIGIYSITIGMIYSTIIGHLYLDGIIPMRTSLLWFTYIPVALLFIGPFVAITIASFTYSTVLSPVIELVKCVRKASHGCSEQLAIPLIVFLTVGYTGFIPCIALSAAISLFIAPSAAAFRLSYLPVHIFTFLYIVIPIISVMIGKITEHSRWSKSNWEALGSLALLHGIGVLFNGYASLQVGLITAKLDNAISTYWLVVFIPLYLLLVFLIFGWLFFICFIPIWHRIDDDPENVSVGSIVLIPLLICLSIILIPVLVWIILFAIRMDLFLTSSFGVTFIPLYIGHGVNLIALTTLSVFSVFVAR
jgi:hypothetical protein